MITVVSGKLGSGKTLDLVRLIRNHVRNGGCVRTNIKLDYKKFARATGRALAPWQFGLVSADDNPAEIPTGDRRGKGKRRTMVVLDEALNWFQSVQNAKEDTRKAAWSEWLRQSDKLGQDVYFVAQNFERAAKWIRELAQVSVEIVNLGDVRLFRFIPLTLIFPFARRMYSRIVYDVRSKAKLQTTLHFRTPDIWNLYDTSETFGFEAADSAYKGHVLPPPFKLPFWLFIPVLASAAISALLPWLF